MNNFSQLYLNGFAILILLLIVLNINKKYNNMKRDEKLFILLSFATIIVLITSAVLPPLWGVGGEKIHHLIKIFQSLDFLFSIIIPTLWLYFCIYRIYPEIKLKKASKFLIPAPLIIHIIINLISYRYGLLFTINEANEYSRGVLFFYGISVGYIYIIAATVFIILKRKMLNFKELILYLLFPILPSIISLLERLYHFPVYTTWAIGSLVLLEIQMHVLNKRSNIDYLTNLNNRMAFDEYVKETINQSLNSEQSFGLIVLDIDNFKKVNDLYGHIEGDRALKATSKILCDSFTGKNFLSRYGGDEFAVVLRECEHDLLDYYLDKLERNRIEYNRTSNKSYDIDFTIGAYIFKEDEITDAHSMFMLVDNLMYSNKVSED